MLFPAKNTEAQKIKKKVEVYLEKELTDNELRKKLADISDDSHGVRISLAANEIFPRESSRIKRGAIRTLDRIGSLLKQTNKRVIVESHTDDRNIQSETYSSNWELSAMRSSKIIRYLVKIHKLKADRLVAVAYAGERPLVPNSSKRNRTRNQRLDFLLVTEDSPL